MNFRGRVVFWLVAVVATVSARGQALAPDFVHGVDYTFERMEATRAVNDAQDRGKIRLVALVYRPLKTDRKEVALFSHGSTGGEIRSPKEPWEGPPLSVLRFFLSRGYTVVAPMRRGRGESSGTYIEECAIYAGQCTLAQQTAMTDRAVREAMLDTRAVIDQVVLGRLVPRTSRLLLVGVSRGGFLSLMMAADRPQQARAVINFVGGWLSVSEKYSAADNEQRMAAQTERLAQAGRGLQAPSLWIYAARDEFYGETTTREFFRAHQQTGGLGKYVFIRDHTLPNGHLIASALAAWEKDADEFLAGLEKKRSE